MGAVISHIAEIIGGKLQVQEEIRTMTAQKQFEQKIMNLIPFSWCCTSMSAHLDSSI